MRISDVKEMLRDISFPSLAIIAIGILAVLSLLLVSVLDIRDGLKKSRAEQTKTVERML